MVPLGVVRETMKATARKETTITVMPIALMRASGTGLLIVLILKTGGLFAHFAFNSSARPAGKFMFLETVCRSTCPAVCLNLPSLDVLRVRPWAYKSFDLGVGTASSRIGHKFRLDGCQRRTVLRY
jgi:hypothetical protein